MTSDTVLRKIYLSLYLKGLWVRGSWRPNRTATYWPPLLWPSAFLSRSPGMLNWGGGGWGPSLSGTCSSIQHLLPTGLVSKLSIGGLWVPSAGCWLSLPHLVSNWLNFLCTVLYNSSTPTFFLWASQLHSFNPSTVKFIILIFLDRMHLLFT